MRSVSAATCVMIVYVPVPRSCDPDCTRTMPSGSSRARADAGIRCAEHMSDGNPHLPGPALNEPIGRYASLEACVGKIGTIGIEARVGRPLM